MKIKHLMLWHLVAMIVLILYACTALGMGACQINALVQGKKYESRYEIRYGHGWYEGERHMWCEYLNNGGTGAGQMAFCDASGTNWTDM